MIREEELWQTDQPVFSVRRGRFDPIILLADTRVGTFDARLIGFALLGALGWTAIFFLSLPTALLPADWFSQSSLHPRDAWWRIPALVVSVIVMMFALWQTTGRARSVFRETSIGFRLSLLGAGIGLMLGSLLLLPGLTSWILALLGLTVAVWAGCSIPVRLARLRARAELIDRLLTTGTRSAGVIRSVDTRSGTELGRPRFRRVEIEYRSDAVPVPRMLLAAMATKPTRVPLPGSPVLVLSGADGTTHVIADPEHPMAFDPNDDRYREAHDGGGS